MLDNTVTFLNLIDAPIPLVRTEAQSWARKALKRPLKAFQRSTIWPMHDLPVALTTTFDVLTICAAYLSGDTCSDLPNEINWRLDSRACCADATPDLDNAASDFVKLLSQLITWTSSDLGHRRLRRTVPGLKAVLHAGLLAFVAQDRDLNPQVLYDACDCLQNAVQARDPEAARQAIRALHVLVTPSIIDVALVSLRDQLETHDATVLSTFQNSIGGILTEADFCSYEISIARLEARLARLNRTEPHNSVLAAQIEARLEAVRHWHAFDQKREQTSHDTQ